jgi:hypothetical protein
MRATASTTPSLSKLVRAQGIVPERGLIDFVAGEPVHGSWWGHPSGRAIFNALAALREDTDVFLCKLLDGKQTYVHRRLWPALLRLQAEASLWPPLSAEARRLLVRVEQRRSVRATGRARLELERSLRVVAHSRHTASGAHVVMLSPFQAHFTKGARLTLAEAQVALGLGVAGRALRTAARPGPGKGRRGGRR